eukprot:scaffold18447_cov96-Isochrysis_galbana.AAC.1
MLQRKAQLEGNGNGTGPPPEQDVPLSIPKKTKLYVEQTQREREQVREAEGERELGERGHGGFSEIDGAICGAEAAGARAGEGVVEGGLWESGGSGVVTPPLRPTQSLL